LPNVNFHGTSIKFILMIMKALHSVLFVVFVSFILLFCGIKLITLLTDSNKMTL
jgi:hypothetical protein